MAIVGTIVENKGRILEVLEFISLNKHASRTYDLFIFFLNFYGNAHPKKSLTEETIEGAQETVLMFVMRILIVSFKYSD